jgi:hypothetical protein
MSRGLVFVRGAEGELAPRLLHGQACAVRVTGAPWEYSDEEILQIVQAVDGAIRLEGVHPWADVVEAGLRADVLGEMEVPAR